MIDGIVVGTPSQRSHTGHLRRALHILGAMLLAIAASLFLGVEPAGAETTLDVTTSADGRYQPGRATPLIVTIQADRAISGTLTVTFDGFPAGSTNVEVPGGSAKEVVMIVTVPPWVGPGSINFVGEDEADNASGRLNLVPVGGDELVAVLPELAARDLPSSATMGADVGVVRLLPFDVDLLDSGPDVLTPFNQLIATPDDLASLEGPRLEAIERWVGANGGMLLVDAAPGTALPFDVDTSSSFAHDAYPLGLGLVRFTDGAAAAGAYDGLIYPTPTRSIDEFPWGGGFGSFPSMNILANDAGIRVPAIGTVVWLLIGYTVIAGPMLWFVLRRTGREPLLWLVLPAVALLTTGAVYAVGQAIRDDTSTAHATIVADLPSQRVVLSQVLVTSPNGGSPGVTLEPGWSPARVSSGQEFFDGPFGMNTVESQVLRGDQLLLDLPPGGVGIVSASRSDPADTRSWAYELEADGDSLVGTVTNLTTRDLREVFVASGGGFARVSAIDAGETVDVTLRGVSEISLEGDRFMEQFWRFDPWDGDADGVMNPGILLDWLSARQELRSPGHILIVGWSRDAEGPIRTTRGSAVTEGRTAYLVAERLSAELLPSRGRVELLRGWSSTNVSDPLGVGGQCADFPATLRITPPADAAEQAPVLDLTTRAIAGMDIWDGTAWLPAGIGEAPRGRLIIAAPDGSLEDGTMYLRVQMSCEFWGLADPFPVVRSATSDDNVLTVGFLSEGSGPDTEEEASTPTSGPPQTTVPPPAETTTTEGG